MRNARVFILLVMTVLLALPVSGAQAAATIVVIDKNAPTDLRCASSVDVGGNGLPRLAYCHGFDGTFWFATCLAADCSGTEIEQFAGVFGADSSMKIGRLGAPVLAFYDSTQNALRMVNDEGIQTVDDDPNDDVGQYASLAIGSDNLPVIAYYDNTTFSLRLAACVDVACTSASIVTIDDDPAIFVGEFVDLTLGADGFPVLAYAVLPNGILRVAKCSDATCSTPEIHDVDGNSVGKFASIAIGNDGNPVMSYFDQDHQALKVAKCHDAACADPATITTLDARGEGAGEHSAIAVRDDGLPVIGYRRGLADGTGTYVLAAAECLTDDCAGGVRLMTLDEVVGDIVGWNVDIAIGADGGAMMTYYDSTLGWFKFAKCDPDSCGEGDDPIFGDGFDS